MFGLKTSHELPAIPCLSSSHTVILNIDQWDITEEFSIRIFTEQTGFR